MRERERESAKEASKLVATEFFKNMIRKLWPAYVRRLKVRLGAISSLSLFRAFGGYRDTEIESEMEIESENERQNERDNERKNVTCGRGCKRQFDIDIYIYMLVCSFPGVFFGGFCILSIFGCYCCFGGNKIYI